MLGKRKSPEDGFERRSGFNALAKLLGFGHVARKDNRDQSESFQGAEDNGFERRSRFNALGSGHVAREDNRDESEPVQGAEDNDFQKIIDGLDRYGYLQDVKPVLKEKMKEQRKELEEQLRNLGPKPEDMDPIAVRKRAKNRAYTACKQKLTRAYLSERLRQQLDLSQIHNLSLIANDEANASAAATRLIDGFIAGENSPFIAALQGGFEEILKGLGDDRSKYKVHRFEAIESNVKDSAISQLFRKRSELEEGVRQSMKNDRDRLRSLIQQEPSSSSLSLSSGRPRREGQFALEAAKRWLEHLFSPEGIAVRDLMDRLLDVMPNLFDLVSADAENEGLVESEAFAERRKELDRRMGELSERASCLNMGDEELTEMIEDEAYKVSQEDYDQEEEEDQEAIKPEPLAAEPIELD